MINTEVSKTKVPVVEVVAEESLQTMLVIDPLLMLLPILPCLLSIQESHESTDH
jgi:hypothetical protein